MAEPGRSFDTDVPVYVLTSSRTGSAAESFAYTLKSLDRATIVGEVTLGMAHPSREVVVNDYFRVLVPYLRSEVVLANPELFACETPISSSLSTFFRLDIHKGLNA